MLIIKIVKNLNMYEFSETSLERLKTCHKDLQEIMHWSLKYSQVDFGIACGHRTIQEQKRLYAQGRNLPGQIVTYVDGIQKRSKHNYYPSQAVDIYGWTGKVDWSERTLIYLGGVITSVAAFLYDEGIVKHELRWGGNWDGDGQIITDQNFLDLPHYELVNVAT